MGTAREIRTNQIAGVDRRAFALDPPVSYETYSGDDWVTATTAFVVISRVTYPVIEIMAFPGTYRSRFGREHIQLVDMSEVAVMHGGATFRQLLEQMGYPSITDLHGITTVRTPERDVENHGWGQGGPGSDDYMSFGVGE